MKSASLSGIAIAMTLVIQSIPTSSAQGVCSPGYACRSHTNVRPGPSRPQYPAQAQYQHYGYAHGQGQEYGVGVGAAALTTGALIGGAIAAQRQPYYPAEPYPMYPRQHYDYTGASEGDSSDLSRLC